MSNVPRIVQRPNPGVTTEEHAYDARDVRARAWAYAFSCFNRRRAQEGTQPGAPDDGTIKAKEDDSVNVILPYQP